MEPSERSNEAVCRGQSKRPFDTWPRLRSACSCGQARSQATGRPSFHISTKSCLPTVRQTIMRSRSRSEVHTATQGSSGHRHELSTEIGLPNVLVLYQFGSGSSENDATALNDVGVVTHFNRSKRVLFVQ